MISNLPIRVTALYHFTRFDDPAAIQGPLLAVCQENGIKGTLLLAREGINGTIAGSAKGLDVVMAHIRNLPGCADLVSKDSGAVTMPFLRMKVRLKKEIVTMGEPDIDPLTDVGHYVEPQDWNALIDAPGTLVIDTRNDYEVKIGTFTGAVDPETKTFRDFPAWVREHREELENAERIAMFCTGGIRCEKSTAFLKAEGLDEVYHLKGGILKYLEEVPANDSRWEGDCFVFDQRVAVGHGLALSDYTQCHACRMPLDADDRTSPLYVEGISCPHCHDERDDAARARYAERQHQEELARKRGKAHLGASQE